MKYQITRQTHTFGYITKSATTEKSAHARFHQNKSLLVWVCSGGGGGGGGGVDDDDNGEQKEKKKRSDSHGIRTSTVQAEKKNYTTEPQS